MSLKKNCKLWACVVCTWQVHVSYLEIYNETGFDLLDPNREVKSMEDLPQVGWCLVIIKTSCPAIRLRARLERCLMATAAGVAVGTP